MTKNRCLTTINNVRLGDIIAITAGTIVPLAFAPFQQAFLTIIAAALLYFIWTSSSPKRACWQGWLFGLGYFGIGVAWLAICMREYGQAPMAIAVLVTFLFVSLLAMGFGIMGYLWKRYFNPYTPTAIVAFASLWTLLEYIRSHVFTGFPWLLIGNAHIQAPFMGFLPIIGVYGTTFVTLLCAGLLAHCFIVKDQRLCKALTGISIVLLGVSLSGHAWTSNDGKPLRVSLLQGNIDQHDKWNPHFLNNILHTYYRLSVNNFDQDLIIWPETAIPTPTDYLTPYLNHLDSIAKQHHSTIMLGAPVPTMQENHYYNALLSMGEYHGHYYKQHLVPFGEYIPFAQWLRPLLNMFKIPDGSYRAGEHAQPLLRVKDWVIAAYICYDIAFNQLVYHSAKSAHVLLTVSDDSWYGHSWAAPQHVQIAQARAIETGRPILFATNNGISAIIDPYGKITHQLPPFTRDALRAEVTGVTGITPIMRYGNLPVIGVILVLLFVCILRRIRSRCTKM